MKLDAAQLEQLRLSLLRFLTESPSRYGCNARYLLQQARNEGRSGLELQQIEAQMLYLEDAALVVLVNKTVSPEIRMWRIHKNGQDYLAQHE